MGYLLVDNLHKQTPEEPSRTQDYYSYVTFILLFARGVIIGGLQRFGTVQLFSLMACEVIQLGFLAWVGATSELLSKPVLIAGARLSVLLLCLGMIPDLWTHIAASALGYVLLAFHALFLVGMFLVPSAYESTRLGVTCYNEWQTPQQPAGDSSLERPQVCHHHYLHQRGQALTLTGLRPSPTLKTSNDKNRLDEPKHHESRQKQQPLKLSKLLLRLRQQILPWFRTRIPRTPSHILPLSPPRAIRIKPLWQKSIRLTTCITLFTTPPTIPIF
ncbi:hypothetical protein FVER14953_12366 [Fusarium verticillioides]|nr:hypothetical protein FVER14953_12366 [Fusarium verticillioides]